MHITKRYEFESAHIVRRAKSSRCRRSVHGHSYKVEVSISPNEALDDSHMVIDFIELKPIKQIIDLFDHSMVFGSIDTEEHKSACEAFSNNSERIIQIPFNTTAECFALTFLMATEALLATKCIPSGGRVQSVTVFETRTGSATAISSDELVLKLGGLSPVEVVNKAGYLISPEYDVEDPDLVSWIRKINKYWTNYSS